MTSVIMLVAALAAQETSAHHVRATEPHIAAMIAAGLSRSETFRRLIDTLDRSDVIVYIEPKVTHQALGAYLAHNVVVGGAFRYLHVAVDVHGASGRIVPLIAHELQHAVEVAHEPAARDAQTVDRLFDRLAIEFGCGGSACSETQAAKDIEAAVSVQLKASH